MTTQPQRAVSAAIYHGGRFLLVQRKRPPAAGLFAFPGGRVEAGETLDQAVRREISEETGARLGAVRHLVDLPIAADDKTGRIEFLLSVHAAEFAGGRLAPGDDAAGLAWYTLEEMALLPLAGSVLEVARRVAEAG